MSDIDVEGQQYFPFFIDIKREETSNHDCLADALIKEISEKLNEVDRMVEEAQELNIRANL